MLFTHCQHNLTTACEECESQQQKCLRGEHEAGGYLIVQTGCPEVPRVNEGLTPYGPPRELASCKHCRCLYVERV